MDFSLQNSTEPSAESPIHLWLSEKFQFSFSAPAKLMLEKIIVKTKSDRDTTYFGQSNLSFISDIPLIQNYP